MFACVVYTVGQVVGFQRISISFNWVSELLLQYRFGSKIKLVNKIQMGRAEKFVAIVSDGIRSVSRIVLTVTGVSRYPTEAVETQEI